jgi:hypothetical protein
MFFTDCVEYFFSLRFDNLPGNIYNSLTKYRDRLGMLIFFMILGLVFLASGSVGLFYVNTHVIADTVRFIGNLAFGTFTFFGVAVLVFLAIFNAEFD